MSYAVFIDWKNETIDIHEIRDGAKPTILISPAYYIPFNRLDEIGWCKHLQGKTWMTRSAIAALGDAMVKVALRMPYDDSYEHVPGAYGRPVEGNLND